MKSIYQQSILDRSLVIEIRSSSGHRLATGRLYPPESPPVARLAEYKCSVIGGIFTDEAHRRKGLATRVMHGLLYLARQRGYRRVLLESDNAEATQLYRNLGFRTNHCHINHKIRTMMFLSLK